MAFGAAGAAAATLKVNTTTDDTASGDGLCSLRKAIAAVDSPGSASGDCAPAAFGANTIVLGPRAYPLSRGELAVVPPAGTLTIIGAGEGRTVIDANAAADRALEVQAGVSVTIRGLTITGGHAADGALGTMGDGMNGGPGGAGADGGAILNAGALSLIDIAITNSHAGSGGDGGGVFDTFDKAYGYSGGAGGDGGRGGAIFSTGTLSLEGVTLANDGAGDGGKGGLGYQSGALVAAGGAGGDGGAGGAIANSSGDVTIIASTIRADHAGSGGAGGTGGFASGASPYGPKPGGAGGVGGAGANGGGVWSDGGALSLINDTVASNAAGPGGNGGDGGAGIAPEPGGAGGHGGDGGGGGGIAVTGSASATALNATVAGNDVGVAGSGGAAGAGTPPAAAGSPGASGDGGGVAGPSVTLRNSLLALNVTDNCGSGPVIDGGHNLSFGGGGCPASFASGDPRLGALQGNGGPTATISLGAGSAAIDQVPGVGAGCPATDQRGVSRPRGGGCEIGAYEVAAPALRARRAQASGRRSVRISATVTPDAGAARVWVQFGRTRSYGRRSAIHTVGGVVPTAVTVKLSGLSYGVRYHYRVVVSTIDGTAHTRDLTLVLHRGGRL